MKKKLKNQNKKKFKNEMVNLFFLEIMRLDLLILGIIKNNK